MPIGIQRINAKKTQPNERVVFIKPLKGPDEKIAQDFLERIAAQCLPIMREHQLSVMSLEEYEPNREFVGRNFNAGEVIQLVLKSPSTGRWLPFNHVQLVMMHELAHCKQMNHSKAFWAVRNQYAEQMRVLWTRSYTGEGLWGRGALLSTGEFERNTVRPDELLPEHICGGTYRSRGRKRRVKPQQSYRERKERRILKKFGANGVALGEDEEVKAELEKGKRTDAKPRVAKSKRGRELRAAAALNRFTQEKKEKERDGDGSVKEEDDLYIDSDESDTATECEDDKSAIEMNGPELRDQKGFSLVKVCEDESPNDADAQNELRELFSATQVKREEPDELPTLAEVPEIAKPKPDETPQKKATSSQLVARDSPDITKSGGNSARQMTASPDGNVMLKPSIIREPTLDAPEEASSTRPKIRIERLRSNDQRSKTGARIPKGSSPNESMRYSNLTRREDPFILGECPLCSFGNGADALICAICSHVLDTGKMPNAWKCKSYSCQDSVYLNPGDVGICGVCGSRKES
ncbi:WLM-domain-containing protein [Xylariaceae sp. FL0016]|nr:WLM-domain-containing protein [Xylariaceae sp. FL0016]